MSLECFLNDILSCLMILYRFWTPPGNARADRRDSETSAHSLLWQCWCMGGWHPGQTENRSATPQMLPGSPGIVYNLKVLVWGQVILFDPGQFMQHPLHWCLSNLERCSKTCQNSRFWTILTIPPTFSSQNSSMGNSIPQDQTGLFSPMLVLNIARHIPPSATTFGV